MVWIPCEMAGHSARVPAALCTTAMSIGATTSERQKAATMAEQASSRNALTAQSTITKTLTVKKLADRRGSGRYLSFAPKGVSKEKPSR